MVIGTLALDIWYSKDGSWWGAHCAAGDR